MRYLTGVVFLASCAMLTPAPVEDRAIERPRTVVSPEPSPQQSESRPEIRKPRPKPPPPSPTPSPSPSPSAVSSCADLDTGDLKETIKAKLDCITENAK